MARALLIFSLWLLPSLTMAALLPDVGAPLEISIRPEYPREDDIVTATVSGLSNKNSVGYIWSLNGEVIEQGIGVTSITLQVGTIGSAEELEVVAVENGVAQGRVTTLIRPSSVDLVWEGNTTVPPFYISRPLSSGVGSVTVLAVPHLSLGSGELAPENLSYTWKVSGIPLTKQSGYGKSSVIITPPRFSAPFTVSVTVTNQSGSAQAESSVTIQPQTPKMLVYENAPLFGVRFDKAVFGTFSFIGDEVSFTAYPLFVSNAKALSYEWSIDGMPFAVNEEKPRDVTFRKVGEGTGTHTVVITFDNPKNFIESGKSIFGLKF